MEALLASLLVAAAGLTGAVADRPPPVPPPPRVAAPRPVPRILCERPSTLRLRRFEDRSAQLICSGRVLARIAVPG